MGSPARNRRGVVTGAGSGIGKAAALRLMRQGIDVIAVDIDEEKLADVKSAGCKTLTIDLSDADARARLAEAADGFDYMVNSHGIILIKSIFDVSLEDWRRIQTVNAESIFFLCQQIGPRLKPGGAIVNLSSSSAKLAATVEVAAYAASKTTITSITRSFAYALASRPVRVNAICPGIVDTPMQDHVLAGVSKLRQAEIAELESARTRAVPLGRAATADECAGLIWFLLSDAASYMTGQAVNFTGGMVTW
ncbi:SDR family oxidoreductase [Mesorhizobium sp. B3-1-9]|uniref:SDR family NAD(P)-dependent oxidoreductase n=1 Tax=unclassified Mesorhizobium TaxID=325217 RepID=UPI0011266306|nr:MULTISPECIES: SDR family oxidoreductase [unclassified Mesorhizobium]TPI38162.1 SDR family oxidoreductase [Mesorhizobium sp. B3-1-9]TPI59056.1 SDR family oxidoreductase [Mesorhizobium sp. B3-1-7]TPI69560.1 SDR family oxidoreductase [Mesorhizobium sp. B3-1-8]TPI73768.1 SDR family oxidoreductase [Mesorhizobium sp. B3-1-3]TPJ31320.1 SDR family oxidoreductase [Mesorhizobium sp. B2-8-3]